MFKTQGYYNDISRSILTITQLKLAIVEATCGQSETGTLAFPQPPPSLSLCVFSVVPVRLPSTCPLHRH